MEECDSGLPITNATAWTPTEFAEKLSHRSLRGGILGYVTVALVKVQPMRVQ